MPTGKLKIAFVSNTSWSIYNFRIDVIRYLMSKGQEVYVIAPWDNYSSKLIAEGIHFIPIKLDNYGINPLQDLRYAWSLFRLYRQYSFHKVYHYTIKPNIYGAISGYLARIPLSIIVVTGLGKMFLFKSRLSNLVSKWLYTLAASFADEVWFLNDHDQFKFIQAGILKRSTFRILPSEGINTQRFRPKAKKESGIIRFLFAGRLIRPKGIYQYISAAEAIKKAYPNTRFEVLGFIDENNPESIHYNELIHWQNKGVINYLGSTEDVRPYLQRADCLVFPSYYQEGLSRILLEAASMATPIITSQQPGCQEVVVDRISGYLCKDSDVQVLIEKIEKILSISHSDRVVMGQRGRAHIKSKYDIELVKSYYSSDNLNQLSTTVAERLTS